METDIQALRDALAKCHPLLERELDVLLTSHCHLEYPDGPDGSAPGKPIRATLEADVREDVEAIEAALAEIRRIAAFTEGARVRLVREIDIFDLGRWPVGTTGTVVRAIPATEPHDDGVIAEVKLDEHHPALAEWDNCLVVFISDENNDCCWTAWMPAEP